MPIVIPTAGIVYFRDRHLVLVEHEDGLWGFPSGRQESGETLFECARREFTEECGLVARPPFARLPQKYFARLATDRGISMFSVDTWATANVLGSLRSSSEGIAHMVSVSDFHRLPLRPNHLEIIERCISLIE